MISGGMVTAGLTVLEIPLPLGLDPNFFGILISLIAFWAVNKISKKMTKITTMTTLETLSAIDNATFLQKK